MKQQNHVSQNGLRDGIPPPLLLKKTKSEIA